MTAGSAKLSPSSSAMPDRPGRAAQAPRATSRPPGRGSRCCAYRRTRTPFVVEALSGDVVLSVEVAVLALHDVASFVRASIHQRTIGRRLGRSTCPALAPPHGPAGLPNCLPWPGTVAAPTPFCGADGGDLGAPLVQGPQVDGHVVDETEGHLPPYRADVPRCGGLVAARAGGQHGGLGYPGSRFHLGTAPRQQPRPRLRAGPRPLIC